MAYDGAHTYGKEALVCHMAYNDPLARCHFLPPFHTGPTCRIRREGVPDWTRIGYSKDNVVGYVIQNEVSLTHGRVGCWYQRICLRVVHCTQAYYHRTGAATTVICDVFESKR